MSDPPHGEAQRRLAFLLDQMSALGHDLRNPISSLLLGVQRLERRGDVTGLERVPAMLVRMERSLRGMDRLVEALLDLARVEGDRLELEPSGEPPAGVVARAVEAFLGAAADRRTTVNVDVPEGLPAPAWDGARTARALAYLLAPALEFTPAGGSVVVFARADGGGVRLGVEDGGPPLAPGESETLFDGTADRPGARIRSRAHGPFLYLARRIAELQGGRAEGGPGERGGARLSIWFPLAPPK
jgi:signal transduction histidine kinase